MWWVMTCTWLYDTSEWMTLHSMKKDTAIITLKCIVNDDDDMLVFFIIFNLNIQMLVHPPTAKKDIEDCSHATPVPS